jgi:hypothetical protein
METWIHKLKQIKRNWWIKFSNVTKKSLKRNNQLKINIIVYKKRKWIIEKLNRRTLK